MPEQPRRIEYMKLEDLVPNEMNPKDHDLDIIGESVHRFGFIDPIILDERTGTLISGHGRLETLLAAETSGHPLPDGLKADKEGRWLAPVSRGWASKNDTEARAALVALNRAGELGGWDDQKLAEILDELSSSASADFAGMGYNETDLDSLRAHLDTVDMAVAHDLQVAAEPAERPTKPFPLEDADEEDVLDEGDEGEETDIEVGEVQLEAEYALVTVKMDAERRQEFYGMMDDLEWVRDVRDSRP